MHSAHGTEHQDVRPAATDQPVGAGAACLAHALGGSLLDLLQLNLR